MMNVSSISSPSGEGKKKHKNGVILPDFQEDVMSKYQKKKRKNITPVCLLLSAIKETLSNYYGRWLRSTIISDKLIIISNL